MVETPAEERGVAERYDETWPTEIARGADECLDIVVGLRDRVGEVGDPGRVAVILAFRSTMVAVPEASASRTSPARSWPWTRTQRALHAASSAIVARRTA